MNPYQIDLYKCLLIILVRYHFSKEFLLFIFYKRCACGRLFKKAGMSNVALKDQRPQSIRAVKEQNVENWEKEKKSAIVVAAAAAVAAVAAVVESLITKNNNNRISFRVLEEGEGKEDEEERKRERDVEMLTDQSQKVPPHGDEWKDQNNTSVVSNFFVLICMQCNDEVQWR